VTVVAPKALLVYGCSGESEFSVFVNEVDSILTGEPVFFLRVVHDAWRVVGDVRGHDNFRPVDKEERREPVDLFGVVRMP
jgi:hypothetical protein